MIHIKNKIVIYACFFILQIRLKARLMKWLSKMSNLIIRHLRVCARARQKQSASVFSIAYPLERSQVCGSLWNCLCSSCCCRCWRTGWSEAFSAHAERQGVAVSSSQRRKQKRLQAVWLLGESYGHCSCLCGGHCAVVWPLHHWAGAEAEAGLHTSTQETERERLLRIIINLEKTLGIR